MKLFSVILCTVFLLANGCVFNKKAQNAQLDKDQNWPEFMNSKLASSGYDSAYGLFSSSGWSNVGQTMVFKKNDSNSLYIMWVKSNGREISGTYELSNNKEVAKYESLFKKALNLKDVDSKTFDGIQFTYQELEKDSDQIKTVKEIYMNNPDLANPKPKDHLELITEMRALCKECK